MINTVRTNLILLLASFISFSADANDYTLAYIEQYKTIVVNEMERTGIPASIKMAQAILESGSGRSTLAKQSNNHFGIKCGKSWTGKEVYRHDDDYRDGLLIRSCFRAYDDPADSFIAHSDFLSNPYSKRYKFLFDLDPYDYNAWAHGLKKAGYATDPAYPSKLINLIEEYRLYELDLGLPLNDDKLLALQEEPTVQDTGQDEDVSRDSNPMIIATSSGTSHVNTTVGRAKYSPGTHIFQHGETMEEVAQKYQMTTRELYFRNRIAFGTIPLPGESLVIDKYLHLKKIPRTVAATSSQLGDDYLFEEQITISSL